MFSEFDLLVIFVRIVSNKRFLSRRVDTTKEEELQIDEKVLSTTFTHISVSTLLDQSYMIIIPESSSTEGWFRIL